MVDREIVMPGNLHADRHSTAPNRSEATRSKPAESLARMAPHFKVIHLTVRYFSVDRGIVMPGILHADMQPTEPNESEAAPTKPVESAVKQLLVPRSAIRQ